MFDQEFWTKDHNSMSFYYGFVAMINYLYSKLQFTSDSDIS